MLLKKYFKIIIRTLITWFVGLFPLMARQIGDKPNVLFILADDLGWSQLGFYGSNYYETPNIDQLAKDGIHFTNAYAASPVSSPTRASIMTGKHPARLHITTHIGSTPEKGRLLIEPDMQGFLPLEETTIAEALKKEGYYTASFGKWHLSQDKTPPKSLPYNPDKQGFNEHFITYKPLHEAAGEWQTAENDAHNVRMITDSSLKFIEENQNRSFFLFMSPNTVHKPIMEREILIEKYKRKQGSDKQENNPVLGAMIETLDRNVGRVLDKLDELGLSENTIVIFFSDNGGSVEKVADQTPLRAGKGTLYEGGIRVPLIIRWPGKIESGRVSDELVISDDFFPTMMEIVGGENIYENIDGKSLVSILTKSGQINRKALYWHFPHYHQGLPGSAIRLGDYKLIEWYEETLWNLPGQVELYNLKEDIGEMNNLADVIPEKVVELRDKLREWREAVGAQMPRKNPNHKP